MEAPKATAKPAPKPPAESTEDAGEGHEAEVAAPGPETEIVNIAGLVLEKTVHPNGDCQTEVIREPMISAEDIRATRAIQRRRGH